MAYRNACQMIDDALKTVGGRLIPSSALSNPGTFDSTYVADLFMCPNSNCRCGVGREDMDPASVFPMNSDVDCSNLMVGVPALPIFPLSATMDFYMNSQSTHTVVSNANLMLHLVTGTLELFMTYLCEFKTV
jgi:hypothetical protein